MLLEDVKDNFHKNLEGLTANRKPRKDDGSSAWTAKAATQPQAEHLAAKPKSKIRIQDQDADLYDGAVVIAAITSCTNTSNPAVMLGAGLVAKKAVERGLKPKPWVKTSLAPGSQVVTDYLKKAGVLADLEKLGFYLVGYGCTTCIGNSGPLPDAVSQGHRRKRPGRGLGALGQPQLRRPRASRGEDELPGLAAAGGRLRAGRHRRHRPDQRAAGHTPDGKAGVPARHLAEQQGNRRHRSPPRSIRRCSRRTTPMCSRATSAGTRSHRRTATLRWDDGLDLHPAPALLRRHDHGRPAASRTCTARACWPCSATRSPPTTSRRPATSRRTGRRAATCIETAWSRRTSTPTARRAATTR